MKYFIIQKILYFIIQKDCFKCDNYHAAGMVRINLESE